MIDQYHTEEPHPSQRARRFGLALLGFILLTPSLFACASQLAIPTVQTFVMSQQKTNLFQPGQFVGMDNYAHMFQDKAFSSVLAFIFPLLTIRLLVVAIVPLLLALVVSQFGRRVRVSMRV